MKSAQASRACTDVPVIDFRKDKIENKLNLTSSNVCDDSKAIAGTDETPQNIKNTTLSLDDENFVVDGKAERSEDRERDFSFENDRRGGSSEIRHSNRVRRKTYKLLEDFGPPSNASTTGSVLPQRHRKIRKESSLPPITKEREISEELARASSDIKEDVTSDVQYFLMDVSDGCVDVQDNSQEEPESPDVVVSASSRSEGRIGVGGVLGNDVNGVDDDVVMNIELLDDCNDDDEEVETVFKFQCGTCPYTTNNGKYSTLIYIIFIYNLYIYIIYIS